MVSRGYHGRRASCRRPHEGLRVLGHIDPRPGLASQGRLRLKAVAWRAARPAAVFRLLEYFMHTGVRRRPFSFTPSPSLLGTSTRGVVWPLKAVAWRAAWPAAAFPPTPCPGLAGAFPLHATLARSRLICYQGFGPRRNVFCQQGPRGSATGTGTTHQPHAAGLNIAIFVVTVYASRLTQLAE